MDDDLKQQVYETLADVFGIMFYIPIEPLEDKPLRDLWTVDESYIEATIEITCGNDFSILPMFFFPEELARNIAINFMGVEEEALDDENINDAAREAVNLSVGGLLAKIDPEAKCQLGVPSATVCEGFAPGSLLDEPWACVYDTEFGYFWVDFGELEMVG